MRAMRPCRKVMAFVYLWGPESTPDYKIISIKPEYSPKLMELEKI